jgi:hypothetical protein
LHLEDGSSRFLRKGVASLKTYKKGKVSPITFLEYREGVQVRLYSFLNLGARWECVIATPCPGRFNPSNGPVPHI